MKITILHFTILVVFLLLVSLLLLIREWVILKRMMKIEMLNAELTGEFSKIVSKYHEFNKKNMFDKTPGIKKYIKKAEHIVSNYAFDIFSLKVNVVRSEKDTTIKTSELNNFKKIINELCSDDVDKENKVLFFEMNNLLEKIYKIQHPFKYFAMTFKKNVTMHFLRIFVKLCKLLVLIRPAMLHMLEGKHKNKKLGIPVENFKKIGTSIKENINENDYPLICAA